MPTCGLIDSGSVRTRRTADGLELDFPVMRAPGTALGLAAFALLCGLMPALGLSALLPLESANASALVSLALIGGFAAPFIFASIVFLLLAVYHMANSLHVTITAEGIRTERRVFGRLTTVREIARADIAGVEPRISARHQNMFSATPRYALIAKHRDTGSKPVIVAEDLCGQPHMQAVREAIYTAVEIKPHEQNIQ